VTVYVESNFVLEIALGQQQSAAAEVILALAESSDIVLAVPSFSLGEPFSTVTQHGRRRKNIANDVSEVLRDLARSWVHEGDVEILRDIPHALTAIERRQLARLFETVERIAVAAIVIGADAGVYRRAVGLARAGALTMPDAIVLSSITNHLEAQSAPGPHYFVTRDAADFAEVSFGQELTGYGCTLIPTFRECVQRLQRPG
jgi:hypothetical protein